jgi:chaperonin GroEL
MQTGVFSNILLSEKARGSIGVGVNTIADAVAVTLGPKGRNVILRNTHGNCKITKDGVSVARHIGLKDAASDAGVQILKEVAEKTSDDAGDGTTTATVLARAIYNKGRALLTVSDADPLQLKPQESVNVVQLQRGITVAAQEACSYLESISKPIDNSQEIAQIATISANGDETIGKLLAEALSEVGHNGFITIEDADSTKCSYTMSAGLEIESGYLNPIFIQDSEHDQTHFEDCFVICVDKKITTNADLRELLPVLQAASVHLKPALLVCHDLAEEPLLQVSRNLEAGTMKLCVIKAPGFANKRSEFLGDLAALAGCKVLNELNLQILQEKAKAFAPKDPRDWASFEPVQEHLGHCDSVTVTREKTKLISSALADPGTPLGSRLKQLESAIEESTSAYDIEQLKKRLAKLVSGIAVIYVGADTVPEQQELKDRVEDALHATQAAISLGIVPGGGSALYHAKQFLKERRAEACKGESDSFKAGYNVLMESLIEPVTQILLNAGRLDLFTQLDPDPKMGIDASTGKLVNMFDAGIIDPLKVTKTALTNAASIAGVLLTTECLIWHEEVPMIPGLMDA